VNGSTVASGGSFTTSETTNFCVGGGPAPSCTDGVQNGDETGVDCGGSCAPCVSCNDGIQNGDEDGVDCGGSNCAPCASCNDGVQNGNETGVDCGGPDCAPCNTGGGCTDVQIDFNNLDSGWGNWNDGGSDCVRSSASSYAYSGTRSIRLRDNTNSSVSTTDVFNLAGFEEVTVDFTYVGRSMENGEDFWLQVSLDNGAWQTMTTYASGTDFSNNVREFEAVTITGTFTSNTRFRFRCDASSNADYVYIDDILLTGCVNGNREIIDEDNVVTEEVAEISAEIGQVKLYPNPVLGMLNVEMNTKVSQSANIAILNANGAVVKAFTRDLQVGKTVLTENTTDLEAGVYYMTITQNDQRIIKKFVVVK